MNSSETLPQVRREALQALDLVGWGLKAAVQDATNYSLQVACLPKVTDTVDFGVS